MRSAWLDGGRVREVVLAPLGAGRWRVTVDEASFEISAEALADGRMRITSDQGTTTAEVTRAERKRFVRLGRADFMLERVEVTRASRPASGEARLESPMPGVVTKVLVGEGEEVRKGQPLLAVEAMKMEHLIRAPHDGRIGRIHARAGEMVNGGVPLVELDGAGA